MDVSLVSRLCGRRKIDYLCTITISKIPVLKLLVKNQYYYYVQYISTSSKDRRLVRVEITFNPTEVEDSHHGYKSQDAFLWLLTSVL